MVPLDDVETKKESKEEPRERQRRGSIKHNDDVIDQQINKGISVVSLVIIGTDAVNSERSVRRARRDTTKISFNFKDVEDTIRPFYGSDCYPIEKWIADFEDLAILFKWNDVQKLVFSYTSLKSIVKTFVHGLSVTQSWEKLKD